MSTQEKTILSHAVGSTAAGTDATFYVGVAGAGTWLLEAVYFVPETSITAHDTNFTDISLENGSTEIASERTTTGDTGDITAGTPVSIALTGTGKDLEFEQGEAIKVKKTDGGSGAVLHGSFAVLMSKLRA